MMRIRCAMSVAATLVVCVPVLAKIPRTTLLAVTRMSVAIVVAKVDSVEKVAGTKVARATVIQSLSGLKVGRKFAFLAERIGEDVNNAKPGETVFIFLQRYPASGAWTSGHTQLEDLPKKLAPTPIFLIAYGGFGRLPVIRSSGEAWIGANVAPDAMGRGKYLWAGLKQYMDMVRLPPGIGSRRYTTVAADGRRLVSLSALRASVRAYLAKISKQGHPSKRRST